MSEEQSITPPLRVGFGLVLLAVLGVLLFLRPGDGGSADPAAGPSPSGSDLAPIAPATAPSEEAFCEGYRMLAASQGQYTAQPDERGAALLRDAAENLLATGVPESMPVLGRTGYLVEISGIYASIGEELDPRAVPGAVPGAAQGTSVSGAAGEFGAWLSRSCPAW